MNKSDIENEQVEQSHLADIAEPAPRVSCDSSATLRSTVAPPRVGALASRQRR